MRDLVLPTLPRPHHDRSVFDEPSARAIAEKALPDVELGRARELRECWFFPRSPKEIGSHGAIVNKRTGKVFQLGSAFSLERDLGMYDRGYQFERYDLVVLAVRDLEETRRALGRLGLQTFEPTYEHGQVWRVPRSMTDAAIWKQLEKLPCIFTAQGLYFRLEVLEEARREDWFRFEALEYRSPL